MEWNPNVHPNAPTRTGQPRTTFKGIESRLVFGRSISIPSKIPGLATTRIVTDYSVRAFLDSFVLPRFPSGFIVTESRGVWHSGFEDSFTVSVVYDDSAGDRRDVGVKLEEIRAEYIRLFRQDSVLRIDTPVSYSFD